MAAVPVLTAAAHISVRGVVQGVGFRPFVYQLAVKHGLRGWVCNTSGEVLIEIEGEDAGVARFLEELRSSPPPRASVECVTVTSHAPAGYHGFEIRPSLAREGVYQLLSPDIATCTACLQEVLDPADRRYRYPFTNCTSCGPRFTIIEDIPYDRPLTTMRRFTMCPDCRREYEDPLDRRFHAQPNACPVCGPRLSLTDRHGNPVDCPDPITRTAGLLRDGKIVAVKGLGGFLLACDATSQTAVMELRARKRRPSKPLALMTASLEEAERYCYVNQTEKELLASPASPIVLLARKEESAIAPAVAPGLRQLGVMLPYTPLHHLLLRESGRPLVMTSGNLSEEPIARDNDEALRRLGGIADYFLMHNRDIYARYDDSVTMVERKTPQLVRRARGYAPYPIHLGYRSRQILGCGAEEKSTFCLTRDDHAFLSQHIGDLENAETLDVYTAAIALYRRLFRIQPEIIAHDLHPEYLSTKYARELAAADSGLTLVPVQHHHAHIASCLVDNEINGPVIGVAFDGTGYGADGALWGGEFLLADRGHFTRRGHLEYLPLPGGALAIRKPYRTALGYLLALHGTLDTGLPGLQGISSREIDIIRRQISGRLNCPLTSSCGRLFDAVAALLDVRGEIDYEAQAAVELEALAGAAARETGHYPFGVDERDGGHTVRLADLLAAVVSDLRRHTDRAVMAARFHNTVARIINNLCQLISESTGIRRVALSGGVFQNRLLLRRATGLLEEHGFEVFTHCRVPCNDGGIALGQVAVASFSPGENTN